MTTTDTLKLYADLHADVPETRPTCLPYGAIDIATDDAGNPYPRWTRNYAGERDPYVCETLALCRCHALEYAAANTQSGCRLADWLLIGKAKSDRNLIDICRAIHAAKGGGK